MIDQHDRADVFEPSSPSRAPLDDRVFLGRKPRFRDDRGRIGAAGLGGDVEAASGPPLRGFSPLDVTSERPVASLASHG